MTQRRKATGVARSTQGRVIKVNPVARGIRLAIAASATALALASGPAFAQSCAPSSDGAQVACDGAFDTPVVFAPVEDLTLVLGGNAPTTIAVDGDLAGAGIAGYGALGITSSADVSVDNASGFYAIGLYAVSSDGPATIGNQGDVTVNAGGYAVAIYAAGTEVDVSNDGALEANGYYWAAGIETQATGTSTVSNTGDITATASAYNTSYGIYGAATGIESVGGTGSVVENSGAITANGTFAKGIYAYAAGTGGIGIANTGDITAQSDTGYAWGIQAVTTVDGADVSVDNGAAIIANGLNAATGIEVTANGLGSGASVTNSGDIAVTTPVDTAYAQYYTASGISVSSDGDASVGNTGSIQVDSYGQAYGISSLSFAGDASIDNDGDIAVTSGKYASAVYGALASSANGAASVDNSGTISVDGGKYYANGIAVSAHGDASATNSGAISASSDMGKYGVFGIQAQSSAGDVSIVNAEGGTVAGSSGFGAGFGLAGFATLGDVSLDNDGAIEVYGGSQGAGLFGVASQGDTLVDNAGSILATSSGTGVGAFARADNGNASVVNSGDMTVSGYYGYGAIARGTHGDVQNTGTVDVDGYLVALGLVANGTESANISNAGVVSTTAYGASIALYAVSDGDVTVSNDGELSATSLYSLADGIFASGANVDVDNSGSIAATGFDWAAGIEAEAEAEGGATTVTSSGDITATATSVYQGYYGHAYGIYATGSEVSVETTGGTITAQGVYATGIQALATGPGDVSVSNGADIVAGDYTIYAAGIRAATGYEGASASVDNSGGITAYSLYGSTGIEVTAAGQGGVGSATNSGDITVTSTQYYATAAGISVSADAGASIANTGSITIGYGDYAYGAQALSFAGDAVVDNAGSIDVTSGFTGYGALAASVAGSGTVTSSGDVTVTANYPMGTTVGIGASGATGATASNSGDILASSGKYNTGVFATSPAGDAVAGNSGSVTIADGKYGWGVRAQSSEGDVLAQNSGVVDVSGSKYATGLAAVSGSGLASATNAGAITVDGEGAAYVYGIKAVTDAGGDVAISNAAGGSIAVDAYGGAAFGLGALAAAGGDVSITNAGDVQVSGTFYVDEYYGGTYGSPEVVGIFGRSEGGDIAISNTGSILATNGFGIEEGVLAQSTGGDVSIVNLGSIDAQYGIVAIVDGGDVVVRNEGTVTTKTFDSATGISAIASGGDSDVLIENAGKIDISGWEGVAFGISASGDADVRVVNSGSMRTTSFMLAHGIQATSTQGDVSVDNRGDVMMRRSGGYGYAPHEFAGIVAYADAGATTVSNEGTVYVDAGRDLARGIAGYGSTRVDVSNSGDVIVQSGMGTAYGLAATSLGSANVSNSGSIQVEGSGVADAPAVGVRLVGAASTVINSGTIDAGVISSNLPNAQEYAFAILARGGDALIRNSGDIFGAVSTGEGADELANLSGGVWRVDNDSTDFGDGDDAISNAAGGTIHLRDGTISLGSGTGNRFDNAGTIKVSGDGLIHMGTGAPAEEAEDAQAAGGAPRMAAIAPQAAVPSLNATPLANNGLIDMVDGAADDSLTIVGDLGGSGALNIDVVAPDGPADQLVVDGSVASGSTQTVNVAFTDFNGLPPTGHTAAVPFAQVTGDSTADAFVGGDVVGFDPTNFLDLDVSVSSQIDESNATPDVFSVGVDVAGLNDTGTIAASAGTGAWSLMTSQVGTWRQRMGVVPPPAEGRKVSAFVRTFYDKGDLDPKHRAVNFGQGGNFAYEQLNSGTEVGINFEPAPGFNIGALVGKSRGKQTLHDPGFASDKIDADTFGIYGTWIGRSGWYVDASYRAMSFDARLDSAAGRQKVSGNAGAINLETGYTFELGSGLRLEPQLQYTWTTVDRMFVQGSQTFLRTDDADFHRTRLGLSVWQPIETGAGITWTPYGTVSAVRVDDAKVGYAVGDVFRGNTSVEGTSALVELGVGMQKAGFSATAGANWTDGGAVDSQLGGQVVVRYSW